MPARHRDLRQAVSWSYALLNREEQRLFCWLAVFAGGCAVAAITGIFARTDEDERAVLDRVSALRDSSLMARSPPTTPRA